LFELKLDLILQLKLYIEGKSGFIEMSVIF